MIEDGRTGWLVEPDSLDQLTDAMIAVLDDDGERLRRGHRGPHRRHRPLGLAQPSPRA